MALRAATHIDLAGARSPGDDGGLALTSRRATETCLRHFRLLDRGGSRSVILGPGCPSVRRFLSHRISYDLWPATFCS